MMPATRGNQVHIKASAAPVAPLEAGQRTTEESSSGLRDFFRRLRQSKFALLGGFVIGIMILSATFAPLIAPHDPVKQNIIALLQGPSREHLLGTDELGRDTLSRIMYGSRVSLMVGVIAVGISLVVGTMLGLVAGYGRGLIDTIIMQVMDGLLAFPALVLALAITAMLGPSLYNAMIAIGITGIPTFARVVRGQVLALRDLEYVQAAQALGAGNSRIVLKHILPNTMAPIIVQTSIAIPAAILAEAGLSFLGLGIQPPFPSWGSMIKEGWEFRRSNLMLTFWPAGGLAATIMAFNFLGDGLRDWLDPRSRVM